MKTGMLLLGAVPALWVAGCTSNPSLSQRAAQDIAYPHQEPYSTTEIETIDEPAGAASQAERGIENPFLVPRAGQTQEVLPQDPLPPRR